MAGMEPSKKKQPPADPAVPPAEEAGEIQALKDQVAKLTDMAARAQADLQNAKGRLERDADELRRFAAEAVLRKLLPTVDNFQRAFQHLPEELRSHEWVKGVTAIEQDFLKVLADLGLKKFESKGQPVDPSRHEVVMQGPGKEGVVTDVYEEGYELHGKVIRPAKVTAGNGQA